MSRTYSTGLKTLQERTGLDKRTIRALTEYISVLHNVKETSNQEEFLVVGENGGTYIVNNETKQCSCPDYLHNLPYNGRKHCKHIERVQFATGNKPIPREFPDRKLNNQIGIHLDEFEVKKR
jgi:predicted nucleic acid-binding Zn finger protein